MSSVTVNDKTDPHAEGFDRLSHFRIHSTCMGLSTEHHAADAPEDCKRSFSPLMAKTWGIAWLSLSTTSVDGSV